MFSTFSSSYKKLPRAGRWGLWLVVVLVVYFGVVEPALDWSTRSAASADKLQKSLDARTRLGEESNSFASTVERGIVAVGAPKTPTSSHPDPSGFLSQKTADIAQKHGVTVKRRTRRGNSPVNVLEWNGGKVERVTLELVVECDTEHLVAFLKDLESSPDITTISSIRMTKVAEPGVQLTDSTNMQITLVPEMWILAKGGVATAEPATSPPPAAPETPEGVAQ